MPGHTNAAFASYAELNCNGVARRAIPARGSASARCACANELTYTFIDDVFGELAA